jgi:hypothetical protein
VDHVPDGVLIRRDQPGDRRYQRARRGRHDDHRPADPDRPVLPAPYDLLQALSLLISQPPRPDRLSRHASMPLDLFTTQSSVEAITATCQQTRRMFMASALGPHLGPGSCPLPGRSRDRKGNVNLGGADERLGDLLVTPPGSPEWNGSPGSTSAASEAAQRSLPLPQPARARAESRPLVVRLFACPADLPARRAPGALGTVRKFSQVLMTPAATS